MFLPYCIAPVIYCVCCFGCQRGCTCCNKLYDCCRFTPCHTQMVQSRALSTALASSQSQSQLYTAQPWLTLSLVSRTSPQCSFGLVAFACWSILLQQNGFDRSNLTCITQTPLNSPVGLGSQMQNQGSVWALHEVIMLWLCDVVLWTLSLLMAMWLLVSLVMCRRRRGRNPFCTHQQPHCARCNCNWGSARVTGLGVLTFQHRESII